MKDCIYFNCYYAAIQFRSECDFDVTFVYERGLCQTSVLLTRFYNAIQCVKTILGAEYASNYVGMYKNIVYFS